MNDEVKSRNGLTPAQTERIALLMEEAGEVVQICGKILRHGLYDINPTTREMNITRLGEELGDVLFAAQLLMKHGDVSLQDIQDQRNEKDKKVWQWLHHNHKE